MENEKLNLVPEEGTENVEQTTEEIAAGAAESPKMYTQEELETEVKTRLDKILPGRIERKEAQLRRDYDRTYGPLVEVLKAGTGKEDLTEITDHLRQSFERGGRKMPQKPTYAPGDLEKLAKVDADEIIRGGMEDVVAETDRLSGLDGKTMSQREKLMFRFLAEHRQNAERDQLLAQMGVPEEVRKSTDFQKFAGQFNHNVPITDVYKLYEHSANPKKEIETMGSMKNPGGKDTGVKDFYSYEEAAKFTAADYDKIPGLHEAVVKSMAKWK